LTRCAADSVELLQTCRLAFSGNRLVPATGAEAEVPAYDDADNLLRNVLGTYNYTYTPFDMLRTATVNGQLSRYSDAIQLRFREHPNEGSYRHIQLWAVCSSIRLLEFQVLREEPAANTPAGS
jgi:hypothetical protein